MVNEISTVGLEGVMGAGKTSVAMKLGELGYQYVPEYMMFLATPLHARFNNWPQKTRLFMLLEIEQARLGSFSTGKTILDRTFFTILAHDYAKRSIGFTVDISVYMNIHIDDFIWPDFLVYIDLPFSVQIERLSARGHDAASYLLRSDFNESIRNYFLLLKNIIPILWINHDVLSSVSTICKEIISYTTFARTITRRDERSNALNTAIREIIDA